VELGAAEFSAEQQALADVGHIHHSANPNVASPTPAE
jgi:hypothetical protein